MDLQAITQIISSLGFPIAMCCYMVWYNKQLNEQHREEMNTLKDALNNNTLAVQHLSDIIIDKEMSKDEKI